MTTSAAPVREAVTAGEAPAAAGDDDLGTLLESADDSARVRAAGTRGLRGRRGRDGRRDRRRARRSAPARRPLRRLVLVAVAVGVLVAALLVPAGLLVRSGADEAYHRLGAVSVAALPALPQRSELLAADGTRLALFFRQNRRMLPAQALPQALARAVVAIEDARFFQHGAIDPRGVLRAVAVNLRSGSTRQGGSTITMQLAKNLRALTAATQAGERAAVAATAARKLRDIRYAAGLEQRLSKREILLAYLNAVYFGDGTYGAEAAAEHYFGVAAGRLTAPQAALLAGMIQNPEAYDPVRHAAAARARRDAVLRAMVATRALSAAGAASAIATPVRLHRTTVANGCTSSTAPFFCDWVRRQLLDDPALGDTERAREQTLDTAGLTIRSTLQPRVQRAADAALRAAVPATAPVAAAVAVVQPTTGAVAAMAVSRPFGPRAARGQTMVNLADGGSTGFQVGSTFKPFVLAAALTRHLPLSTKLHCPQKYLSRAFPKDRPFPYPVANAGDSEAGTFTLTSATWQSVNTCYIQLEERTGLGLPARIAESLGVRRLPGQRPILRVPSLTLGTNETSPLAMAGAYAALSAGGRSCPTTGLREVRDGQRVRPLPRRACRQALNPAVAHAVTSVLRGVIDGPDARRTGLHAGIGRPAAGKTGTTQDYSAAWFVGYTRQLAAAVWLGDPAGGHARPLRNITINGRHYRQVYGGDLPARIWAATMRASLSGVRPTPVP